MNIVTLVEEISPLDVLVRLGFNITGIRVPRISVRDKIALT